VNSPEPDAAEELTIPEGLRFATNDTLPNLTTLTVEGGLNALEASLAKVTKLTVTGRLVAPKATYNGLTELTVEGNDTGDDDDPGFVVTTPLTALQSLTVNADGIFTSASPVGIGAASTSTEGFTLTINKGGKADIASITKLKAATVAGTLTTLGFTKNDSAGTASPLAIAEGGTINGIKLPSVTTVSAITSADSITIEDFTIAATQTFKIPGTVSAPAKTLTIAAGKTFTYDGVVTIEAGGSLVLATATGSVAKIAGTGKIDAGATTIIGGWEAVGTGDGTLTISSEAGGIGAKITGAALATGLKASAASANITQRAGIENNALAIAVTTQLDLNGASITLMSAIAANNPASLSLAAATTAVIITGTDTAAVALADAGGLFVKTTAVNGKVLCSAIDSTTGLVINKGTTTATKLAKITGGSAAQTIKATALNVDGAGIPITIDKDSPVS
jgi:hypothetical protein